MLAQWACISLYEHLCPRNIPLFIIELMQITTKGQMKWVAMDGVRRHRPHIGGLTPLPMVTSPAWSPGLVLMKTVDPMKAADRSAST